MHAAEVGPLLGTGWNLYTRLAAEVVCDPCLLVGVALLCARRVSGALLCDPADRWRAIIPLSVRCGVQVSLGDELSACRSALSDVERRVSKYAEEDPTELPMLPVEAGAEGTEAPPPQRAPTKQQESLTKLAAALMQLQSMLVRGGDCTVGGYRGGQLARCSAWDWSCGAAG